MKKPTRGTQGGPGLSREVRMAWIIGCLVGGTIGTLFDPESDGFWTTMILFIAAAILIITLPKEI